MEEEPGSEESAAEDVAPMIYEPEPAPEVVAEVVDVRFRVAGRAAAFDLGSLQCVRGDALVVQTDRGPELGEAIAAPRARFPREDGAKLPRVTRVATDEDLARAQHNRGQEEDAARTFRELADFHRLPLKLLRVDYRFDGGKAAFWFLSTQGRVEHRALARDLSQKLHCRVEMRQIGDRDQARLVGGMGPCGRELCCSSWIREFEGVSIKHAKEQGLSLNPGKLAGMCGRLKCCLRYEYDTYAELRRGLPRVGKKVKTIHGDGVVTQQAILKRQVVVRRFEDEALFDCSLEDLVERKGRQAAAEESAPESAATDAADPARAATPEEITAAPDSQESSGEVSEWEAASTPDPKPKRRSRGGRGRKRRPDRSGAGDRDGREAKSKTASPEKAATGKDTEGAAPSGEKKSRRRRRPRGRRGGKSKDSGKSS